MNTTLATITLSALATIAFAGPLDPPAGPIDSTMKTLDEVEPRTPIDAINTPGDDNSTYKITQPGSYYVPRNISFLQFGAARHAIEVAADNVTIDFEGFSFITLGEATLNGVTTDGVRVKNVTVKNGTLIGFNTGIALNSTESENIIVENMRVLESDNTGIIIHEGRVSECIVRDSAGVGIYVLSNGFVNHCTSENNQEGIYVGANTIVHDNIVRDNTEDGIRVAENCIVRNNLVTENGIGFGITAGIQIEGNGSLIDSNVVNNNEIGLRSMYSSVFVRNIVSGNFLDLDISPVLPGLADESSTPNGAGAWDNIVLP